MRTDLIIVNDYCRHCHIEPTFIYTLERDGLIEIDIIDGEKYLPHSQLHEVERYIRMYYDLSINVEGIDAILHLLKRIEKLTAENNDLKRKLKIYETGDEDRNIDEL